MNNNLSTLCNRFYRHAHCWLAKLSAGIWQLGITLLGTVFLLLSKTGYAAQIYWPEHEYGLFSQNDQLGAILTEFSNNYGYPSVVSDQLYAVNVSSITIPQQPAYSFLERLSSMYAFHWYFDGVVIYYYAPSEMANEVIRLAHITPAQLKTTLMDSRVWDTQCRCNWRPMSDQVVAVTGPPKMVALVKEAVSVLDVGAANKDEYQIRIFKLKHASAADLVRSQGATVPGVVSMLKRIVERTFDDVIVRTPAPILTSGPQEAIQPLPGLATWDNDAVATETSLDVSAISGQASIEADVRMNAVVVYDKVDRMAMYEQFIQELDKPVAQVEIQVSIINVKTETLEKLGVDWRFGVNGDTEFGFGNNPGQPEAGQLGVSLGTTFSSGVLPADFLRATINALRSTGDVNVVSRPSVMTSDNLEAQLDFTETFYVRVTSRDAVDLFPVTVGAILNITPHVVYSTRGQVENVRLNIAIEDGKETGQDVDGVPTTQTTSITTQAVVGDNESIVIGGYYYDTLETSEQKVPGLHYIPIVGSIFKSKATKSVNMSRVFIITPRVVNMTSGYQPVFD